MPLLFNQKYEKLQKENKELKRELNVIKKKYQKLATITEQKEKTNRKKAYVNKKWKPKSQPMTLMIYEQLIDYTLITTAYKYKNIRLRIALCILFLTGIKIKELLRLKVYHLQTLLNDYWISIDSSKEGSNNERAFLSEEGKKVRNERKRDFEFLFYRWTPDSYVFTSEFCTCRMLQRETIIKNINKVMTDISNQLSNYSTITVYSFRIGDIKDLWEDSRAIELVRHSIYLQRFDTTGLNHYSGSK